MDKRTVMVCISDHKWTLNALHLACALGRNTGMEVVLVKMLPVQQVGWLGTDLGLTNFSEQDYVEICGYQKIAEDYGVQISPRLFQFVTLRDAIADAADHFQAGAVFATLPRSSIPYWRKYQLWSLTHRLNQQDCPLFTLEQPGDLSDWTPSVTAPALRK